MNNITTLKLAFKVSFVENRRTNQTIAPLSNGETLGLKQFATAKCIVASNLYFSWLLDSWT